MITGKSVVAGNLIKMPKLSRDVFVVTEVKDGQVTVRRKTGKGSKSGRWWLEYQQVREEGIRLSAGEEQR